MHASAGGRDRLDITYTEEMDADIRGAIDSVRLHVDRSEGGVRYVVTCLGVINRTWPQRDRGQRYMYNQPWMLHSSFELTERLLNLGHSLDFTLWLSPRPSCVSSSDPLSE